MTENVPGIGQLNFALTRKLPDWTQEIDLNTVCVTPEEQMAFVVKLLEKQIEHKSGGPFAAAIFDRHGKLVSIGVNQVVPWNDPTAHAEGVAIRFAGDRINNFSLGLDTGSGREGFTLVTSGQPCGMCHKSVSWAGISRVLIGAPASEAEKIGFKEDIFPNWREDFAEKGIEVVEGLRASEVAELYARYAQGNGQIYNGTDSKAPGAADLCSVASPTLTTNRRALAQIARLDEAANYIRGKIAQIPETFIILGSGLGSFVDKMDDKVVLPYAEIPNMPLPRSTGHAGNFVVGNLNGKPIVALQGRIHMHDGSALEDVVFSTQLMARLGAKNMLVTNAAGSVNPRYEVGDLMILSDHISLYVPQSHDPGLAFGGSELAPSKHYAQTYPYDSLWNDQFRKTCIRQGVKVHEGVYAFLPGPRFESAADIRALRLLGADVVGMSSVIEALAWLAANLEGSKTGAKKLVTISAITNKGSGLDGSIPDDNDVKIVGNQIGATLAGAMGDFLSRVN